VSALSAYFAPKGLRMLGEWLAAVQANVMTSIVQPGRFRRCSKASPFTCASAGDGQLQGIFIDDQRNPAERITVLAEAGEIIDNDKAPS